jgi:hypothetical protein
MVRPLGLFATPAAAAAARVSSAITQRLAACERLPTCQLQPSEACAASMLAPAVGIMCWFCAEQGCWACRLLPTVVCARGLFCPGLSFAPPVIEAIAVPRLDQDCTDGTCSLRAPHRSPACPAKTCSKKAVKPVQAAVGEQLASNQRTGSWYWTHGRHPRNTLGTAGCENLLFASAALIQG